jgi:Smg protein
VLTLLVLWAHKSELPVLIGDDLMMALHGVSTMH